MLGLRSDPSFDESGWWATEPAIERPGASLGDPPHVPVESGPKLRISERLPVDVSQ